MGNYRYLRSNPESINPKIITAVDLSHHRISTFLEKQIMLLVTDGLGYDRCCPDGRHHLSEKGAYYRTLRRMDDCVGLCYMDSFSLLRKCMARYTDSVVVDDKPLFRTKEGVESES